MSLVEKLKGSSQKKTVVKRRRDVDLGGDITVSLPEKANIPPTTLGEYSFCLFGEKGIGKTSLAGQFPQALIFEWEPGRKNLSIRQIPDRSKNEPPLTWPRFRAYLDLLIAMEKKKRPQTLVIDTIDRAYECCLAQVCFDAGMSHPNDANDYGATWSKVKREFEEQMNSILEAGMTPIFISHARLQQVQSRTGGNFDMLTPTCQGVAWNYMKAACDVAFYYGYHGKERSITVRGSELIWSACGLDDHFLTSEGKPLEEFCAGESCKEAYERLLNAFDNRIEGYTISNEEKDTERAKNLVVPASLLTSKKPASGRRK